MLLLPVARPVAKPLLVMVATVVLLELQVTAIVRFCWLPSL